MRVPIKLESIGGEAPVEIAEISGGTVTIGREPENSIVIDSLAVSRRHAYLFQANQYWIFCDLGSTNGSLINGMQLHKGQLKLLREGDIIQIADFFIRIHYLPSELLSEPLHCSLLIFSGEQFYQEFIFQDENSNFHFGGPNSIQLFNEEVSDILMAQVTYQREHLELTVKDLTVSVVVNGSIVSGSTSLADRDEIQISNYRLLVNDVHSKRSTLHLPSTGAMEKGQYGNETQHPELSNLPAQIFSRPPPMIHDGWESAALKRKIVSGRKFVFSSLNDDDISGTLDIPIEQFDRKRGFEANQSWRMLSDREGESSSHVGERMLSLFIAVAVGLFVGLMLFVWLQLQA